MKTLHRINTRDLPLTLPPAGAYLYGHVDATIDGYNKVQVGATTYTLASAVIRGDALAAAVTTAGVSCGLDNGIFSLIPPSAPDTFRCTNMLGVLMGIFHAPGSNPTDSVVRIDGQRISPVAIPLSGFSVRDHSIAADDEVISDRLVRDTGYTYGAARVLSIEATMHRWSLDALLYGWCMTGRVAFVGPNASDIDAGVPEGSALGVRIISVDEPRFIGAAQLWATVRFTVAMEDA